jgi:hypothetical protein
MAPSSTLIDHDTLVDFDPLTQIATHVDVDDNGIMTVASMQDVEDIVEANKVFYNSTDERAPYKETFTYMAQIPLNIWFELWRTGVAQDERALRKWLDDSDYSDFRTRPGKMSR